MCSISFTLSITCECVPSIDLHGFAIVSAMWGQTKWQWQWEKNVSFSLVNDIHLIHLAHAVICEMTVFRTFRFVIEFTERTEPGCKIAWDLFKNDKYSYVTYDELSFTNSARYCITHWRMHTLKLRTRKLSWNVTREIFSERATLYIASANIVRHLAYDVY